jgi:molybdopterin molybdotransferase
MISVQEARTLIRNTVPAASVISAPLWEAASLVLANDIIAPYDIPAFRQSSVDGYAFIHADRKNGLRVEGQVPAGAPVLSHTTAQTATRIFTGAPVPDGADTVVMQEKTTRTGDSLLILDENIKQGDNVRPAGAEIRAGETAMRAGTLLTPVALGFLSGIGIDKMNVYPAPRVTIILTGNEICQPGQSLSYGQVFDASSVMLASALKQIGIADINLRWAADTASETEAILRIALEQSDLVLATGGVSVGDYDFVAAAAKACNIQQHFHRIKQKPGKPLLYGTLDNKMFLGLPGNPSSVLTCFYEYVLPAIEQYMHQPSTLKVAIARAKTAYSKPQGLTHFIKAYCDGDTVTALHAQESYRLHSFVQANCLIVLPEESTGCAAGDKVTIHILPF